MNSLAQSSSARKEAVIESIVLEDHRVEVSPGEPAQLKPCLVVRLAFPANFPCLVDPSSLKGLQVIGHEHRIYSQAGKYTGLFWPVNQAEFQAWPAWASSLWTNSRSRLEPGTRFRSSLSNPVFSRRSQLRRACSFR